MKAKHLRSHASCDIVISPSYLLKIALAFQQAPNVCHVSMDCKISIGSRQEIELCVGWVLKISSVTLIAVALEKLAYCFSGTRKSDSIKVGSSFPEVDCGPE